MSWWEATYTVPVLRMRYLYYVCGTCTTYTVPVLRIRYLYYVYGTCTTHYIYTCIVYTHPHRCMHAYCMDGARRRGVGGQEKFTAVLSFPQPETLISPTTVLKTQKGNTFDYGVLLTSLLIGVGYDAYCVCGYATSDVTLFNQTRRECPLLGQGQPKVTCSTRFCCVILTFQNYKRLQINYMYQCMTRENRTNLNSL